MYLLERIALGERLVPCRRGLLFIGDTDSCWHVIVYDTRRDAFDGLRPRQIVPMTAATPDGVWLEGLTRPEADDAGTGVHYLSGVGPLFMSGGGDELASRQARPVTTGWAV